MIGGPWCRNTRAWGNLHPASDMRLLLFSDLHCDRAAAGHLVERAAAVDVVVGAGDFGNIRRNVGTTA